MQLKLTYNLLTIALWIGFIFLISIECDPAQSTLKEQKRIKDFGKSLKKFEKKEEGNSENNKNNSAKDEETIRVETDLVVNDVLVVNQKGNIVLGLSESDFAITENGTLQKVGLFSFGENAAIPRSIVLIIDHSASQKPFLKNSIQGAKNLVDELAPQDKMAIVSDDVKLVIDFTKNKDLLKRNLDGLELDHEGSSKQFSALVAVLNEMFDEEDICPIVIFQTDGDQLFQLKTSKTKFSYDDVYALVRKSRATIYSIIPGFRLVGLSPEERAAKMSSVFGIEIESAKKLVFESHGHLSPELALSNIAQLSGGYTDYIENPEDAENVYSNIFKVINNRYVIGYYPVNEEKAEKRRNVKIEVKGHPEYIILGRKSFFAPEQ